MSKLRSSLCIAATAAGLALAAGTAHASAATSTGRVAAQKRSDTIIRPVATLYRNQAWTSGNGRAILRLQQDGNLVLYKNGKPAWQAPGTWSHAVSAVFQQDGNFVAYASGGRPVWAAGTWHKGTYLAVQDDGNLVIYNSSRQPVWATDTGD